jgi:hypothetical protein
MDIERLRTFHPIQKVLDLISAGLPLLRPVISSVARATSPGPIGELMITEDGYLLRLASARDLKYVNSLVSSYSCARTQVIDNCCQARMLK